jgi:hypothetical protein
MRNIQSPIITDVHNKNLLTVAILIAIREAANLGDRWS